MLSLGLALLAATATNVPLTAMTRENHALVQPVAEHHNLRRQYAARWFRGRPEHFEFLMDHMVACSVLAQALGLIAYRGRKRRRAVCSQTTAPGRKAISNKCIAPRASASI